MNAETNSSTLDKPLATDVALFLINTREFYQQTNALRLNYAKKMKQGVYDRNRGIDGLLPHVMRYVKSKEFEMWYEQGLYFSMATRIEIAGTIIDHWHDEIKEKAQELRDMLKTASDLKYMHERNHPDSHFFERSTMKFFGDSMKNYGIRYVQNNKFIELYRKRPVMHGLRDSRLFDAKTFACLGTSAD